jgi:hypothetical protein
MRRVGHDETTSPLLSNIARVKTKTRQNSQRHKLRTLFVALTRRHGSWPSKCMSNMGPSVLVSVSISAAGRHNSTSFSEVHVPPWLSQISSGVMSEVEEVELMSILADTSP